jgi:UDP-2,3-diacylglucosamine pyrophosphatase LpxH
VRLVAISDLHVGVTVARDGLRHALADFERWLDVLEDEFDAIVLLGDVFQADHTAWPGARRQAAELKAVRRRVGSLASRLDRAPFVYVHGNHDAIAASELGAPASLRIDVDGIDVWLEHGHAFDPVARRAQWLADLGTYSTGRLRACGLRPIAEWIEGRDIAIKHERFGGARGHYVGGAREIIAREGVDVVVMGHTHVAELHALGGHAYANTGSCSRARFEGVVVDGAAGTVETRIWTAPAGIGPRSAPRVASRTCLRIGAC